MSPITKELELNDDTTYIIWHTSSVAALIGPIIECLERRYHEIYGDYYSSDCVQTHTHGANIDTINPRLRIKELKIFINEAIETPRRTKIDITVDHNTRVEYFNEYVNSIRRTLATI